MDKSRGFTVHSMTQIDDLRKGQYVAVTQFCVDESEQQLLGHVEYSGIPLEVLAISLPFICLRNVLNDTVSAMDVRNRKFQRVTPQYVRQMRKASGNKPLAKNEYRCTNCGTSLATNPSEGFMFCPACEPQHAER